MIPMIPTPLLVAQLRADQGIRRCTPFPDLLLPRQDEATGTRARQLYQILRSVRLLKTGASAAAGTKE
jgi:hypothetical protein